MFETYTVDQKKGEVKVDDAKCIGCGICSGICPEWAIKMINKETNEVVWNPEEGGMAKIYNKLFPVNDLQPGKQKDRSQNYPGKPVIFISHF